MLSNDSIFWIITRRFTFSDPTGKFQLLSETRIIRKRTIYLKKRKKNKNKKSSKKKKERKGKTNRGVERLKTQSLKIDDLIWPWTCLHWCHDSEPACVYRSTYEFMPLPLEANQPWHSTRYTWPGDLARPRRLIDVSRRRAKLSRPRVQDARVSTTPSRNVMNEIINPRAPISLLAFSMSQKWRTFLKKKKS